MKSSTGLVGPKAIPSRAALSALLCPGRGSRGGKVTFWMAPVAALFLCSSCMVGPDYHPPQMPVPESWSAPVPITATNEAPALAEWWQGFHDSELNSLITRASTASLQVRIAQARLLEARAQRGVVAGDLWPVINANAGYTRNRITEHYFLPLPPGTPLDYNLYQAGFDSSWEIDIFGGTRRSIQAADAQIAAAEYSRRDILVSLLAEVARQYFQLRQAQHRFAIAQENLASQTNSLQLTQDRYRSGLASELDVQQATALLAATQAQLPLLESDFALTAHRLAVLLGQPPGALLTELTPARPIAAIPIQIPVELPSELMRRRPDIQQAERELAASTARIGAAKADLFPRFSLTGNVGLQSVTASDWFDPSSRFWSAGPTVVWRIFDAGRIRANIQVQTAREEQALASYENRVLTAFEEVENALTAYAKEQVRYRSLETSAAAQRSALRLSQDLYQHGLADFLRVLESARSLYQAEDALVQSQSAVVFDLIALYKALGGGWEIGQTNGTQVVRQPENHG